MLELRLLGLGLEKAITLLLLGLSNQEGPGSLTVLISFPLLCLELGA